jgi:hypothetical protein
MKHTRRVYTSDLIILTIEVLSALTLFQGEIHICVLDACSNLLSCALGFNFFVLDAKETLSPFRNRAIKPITNKFEVSPDMLGTSHIADVQVLSDRWRLHRSLARPCARYQKPKATARRKLACCGMLRRWTGLRQ